MVAILREREWARVLMLWDEMAEEVDAVRSNLSICMHAAAVTVLLDFHGDVSPLERVGK